ncbi:hypothetical protein ACFVVX_00330 [Kitasatospora sp. NPDC058170]|uniref:hypothetical protein n=1 Tax=Kitasatospora sp. NPDC058170 TaxID=3346364 RepID=UPI0036DC37CF
MPHGRTAGGGRTARAALLCLLPTVLLALSACGSDTPSMNLGQAEGKVKAYASGALAVLPDKDTVKVAEPLVDKDECEVGPAGSPSTYMPYITYDLRGIPGPKVHGVFEAVQQRLKQDGFSVKHSDDRRLDLSNDANRFTASVVVGQPDTAPDTLYLTVIAPCVERGAGPGASASS